jgi:hypothetical protein
MIKQATVFYWKDYFSMNTLKQAVQAQIDHIQQKTGRTFTELSAMVTDSGLTQHSRLREMFMRELNLTYGDANALVHAIQQTDGTRAAKAKGLSAEAVLDEIYSDPKAGVRPIHDALMAEIVTFGEFETLPKKGYVSLRHKKQFAMIGPATRARVDVGINIKDLPPDARLLEQPKGSLCNYVVQVTGLAQVDAALIGWLKAAFEAAG